MSSASSGNVHRDEAFNDIFGLSRSGNKDANGSRTSLPHQKDPSAHQRHIHQPPPLDVASIPALPQPSHYNLQPQQQQQQQRQQQQQQQQQGPPPQPPQQQLAQMSMRSPTHVDPQYAQSSNSSSSSTTLDPSKRQQQSHSTDMLPSSHHNPQQRSASHPHPHPHQHPSTGPNFTQQPQQYNQVPPPPQQQHQQYAQPKQYHSHQQQPVRGQGPPPQTQHAYRTVSAPHYPHPHQHHQHQHQHQQHQQQPYAHQPQQHQQYQQQHHHQQQHHAQQAPPNSFRPSESQRQQLPPLKVNMNALPEAVPERLRGSNSAQNSPIAYSQHSPLQSSSSNARSPILRQGLGFFNRSGSSQGGPQSQSAHQQPQAPRSVSTGAMHLDIGSTGSSASQRSVSLHSSSHDKYHQQSIKPTTLSGRIIPQKIDMSSNSSSSVVNNNGNGVNHINGNGNSGNSSPNLVSKSRSFSSLAKGPLSKRKSSSSANLKSMDRSVSNSSLASKTIVMASRRPSIYPALLSRVAKLFQETLDIGSRFKNGLEYRDSFTGSEAVDVIAHIIRTSDRNLALLLGRALDAQRFFHDVTYEHRLRDTQNEVYQFNTITTFYEDPSQIESRHNSVSSDNLGSPLLNQNGQFMGVPASQQIPLQHQFLQAPQQAQAQQSMIMSMGTVPVTPQQQQQVQIAQQQQQQQQQLPQGQQQQQQQQMVPVPVNGVFTLLTECYSPTCTKDRLCYSIACPRRLEQQARLNLKPQGGLKNDNLVSLQEPDESKHLWSYSVPKDVLDSVDKKEAKRQESIFEAIYTERDFVKDLEYMRDFWIRPLRESNIIPEKEREKFIRTVFNGIHEILAVNSKFAEALTRRQNQKPIVDHITDIFLQYIPHFEPFVYYGAGQVFGKYEYERQKTTNALFARFVEETERLKESRRLDISSFLSKPTTRMPKYILLLRTLKQNTRPDSPDYENLDKAISLLQKLLDRINEETGKAADRHELIVLKQKLQFRPGEYVDLRLSAANRRLLYKGVLKRRNQDKENQGEIHVYLFDHAVVFVKIKMVNKREQHKVFQRPIPLQLLYLSANEDTAVLRQLTKRSNTSSSLVTLASGSTTTYGNNGGGGGLSGGGSHNFNGSISTGATITNSAGVTTGSGMNSSSSIIGGAGPGYNGNGSTSSTGLFNSYNHNNNNNSSNNATGGQQLMHTNSMSSNMMMNPNSTKFPLTFLYIGRKGYDMTLYAPNFSTQHSLVDKIEEQHRKLVAQNDIFTLKPLMQKFFDSNNKINCVAPFDGGRRLLYGTDSGIYISNIKMSPGGNNNNNRVVSTPIKVVNKVNIIQLEVLEEYQCLLVLADKKLMSWSLDIFQAVDPNKNAKLGRELMTHVSFFRVGICSGRMLVCAAKNGSNHLIRVFEPIDPIFQQKKLNKKKFKNETRELFFNSEPVSISFLKTKLCVGCTKGFEIVSMETNSMESLLDPADTSLDFVTNKEGLKPLEIDRINSDFLLSYSDFSFYVNRNGWRSRSNFLITWEGLPQSFAIWYPYLLAFDVSFIEIRHVETGELVRVINGENIRLLHSSSQEILYAYEDERGYDVVASLDFWDKSMRGGTVDGAPAPSTTTTNSASTTPSTNASTITTTTTANPANYSNSISTISETAAS